MDKLSNGQKKKVILSFAVATNSKILILDEPTNGLDIPSKSQFRALIAEAMLEDRIIIISTHQVRDMVNLIDPIVIVEDGKIIFNYTLEQIAQIIKFEHHFSMTEPENVLYFERIAGGREGYRNHEPSSGHLHRYLVLQRCSSSSRSGCSQLPFDLH